MKKAISLLLALILMLTLAACGSNSISAPEDSVYKADVQAYINDVLDCDSEITIFEKKNADLNGNTLTVTCLAVYDDADGQTMTTFTLTYSHNDKGWDLEKCHVEMDKDESADPADTTPSETTPPSEPDTPPATETSLSDNWQDFTFELSGHTYKLPCHYQEFVKNGFALVSSSNGVKESDKLKGYSHAYVTLTNGAVTFNANLVNLSGNSRVFSDCDIGSITIEASDNLGLKLAKGIHPLSTPEEVQSAYGTPSRINTADDYTSLYYELNDNIEMAFYLHHTNTTYNDITLTNYVAAERDATVTSTERPAYLDTYVAPTSLSNSPTSTQFQLDGVVYHLPCPLSTFIDNGWSIKSDSIGYLGAGNRSSGMTLEKNGVRLIMSLMNFAEVQVSSANCAVTDVSIDEYYMKDVSSDFLKLPTGLNFDSTAEDLANACQDFSFYEGSSSVSYTAENDEYTWKIRYSLYDGKFSVEIKDIVWDY